MKINVLNVCADGTLEVLKIDSSVEAVRRELGACIDNIKLFTDVQSFICRLPNDFSENVLLPGIRGYVIITGGRGSYLTGLTDECISNLFKIFGKEYSHGKARLSNQL